MLWYGWRGRIEGPERVVPTTTGRREAEHPFELCRRIVGIRDGDHEMVNSEASGQRSGPGSG
jgi:hypothetical protein